MLTRMIFYCVLKMEKNNPLQLEEEEGLGMDYQITNITTNLQMK